MYKRILLAYDGSLSGQKALLGCKDIAQWGKSELFLVAVMPSPATFIGAEGGVYGAGTEERDREQYQAILDEGIAKLAEAGHQANGEVLVGDAVDEIARCAARIEAALIVVGHREQSTFVRWWTGSTGASLLGVAPCSVLIAIA